MLHPTSTNNSDQTPDSSPKTSPETQEDANPIDTKASELYDGLILAVLPKYSLFANNVQATAFAGMCKQLAQISYVAAEEFERESRRRRA